MQQPLRPSPVGGSIVAQSMNQPNQQNQNQSQFAKEVVRVDISASGNKQDATALGVLIARTLQERLPDLPVEVLGQDERIQTGLDSGDLAEVFQFDFGKILVVVDQNQAYQDPMLIENLRSFHVPMEATNVSHERSLQFLRQNGTLNNRM
jgi:hypothetical protein